MRKNTVFTLAAAALTLMGLGCSCCCGGDKGGCGADKSCPPQTVKKAVTPGGEVLYIVAVWNAGETCADGQSCPTAQCWKTADGRTFCAKPVKKCAMDSKCARKKCFRNTDGKLHEPEKDAAAVVGKNDRKAFAVKEIKPCPAGGKCGVPEHVKMQDGKPGCAKADLKHAQEAKADLPMPLGNDVVEDDFFIAFAN